MRHTDTFTQTASMWKDIGQKSETGHNQIIMQTNQLGTESIENLIKNHTVLTIHYLERPGQLCGNADSLKLSQT